jgi:hypothetical protein
MLKALSMVAACGALAGCVDARKSFDDYSARVVDSNMSLPDHPLLNKIPDATGHFFMAVHVAAAGSSSKPILLVADWKVTDNGDGTGKASYSASALTVNGHQVSQGDAGDTASQPPQFHATDMPIAMDGTFTAALAGDLPADANPISVGTPVPGVMGVLHGVVLSKDTICGTLTGTALVDLSGSTWAGIRIPDGQIGTDLPTPVTACP